MRRAIIRAAENIRIIGHNLGTAGTNINVSEFANRLLTTGRFATETYSVAVGAWLVT